jgi:ferredoxin
VEEARRCYLYPACEIDRCIYCRACIEVAPRNCIKLVGGVEIADDGTYGKLIETKEWNKIGAIWIDNNECIRCAMPWSVDQISRSPRTKSSTRTCETVGPPAPWPKTAPRDRRQQRRQRQAATSCASVIR